MWLCLAGGPVASARAEPAQAQAAPSASAGSLEAPLARAVAHVKAQVAAGKPEAIAVHITSAGHWQLANARGEMVTAAGAEEVRRALVTLRGDGGAKEDADRGGPVPPLALLLTDEAAGRAGAGLVQLPAQATLSLLVGTLLGEGPGGATSFRLQRRPGPQSGTPDVLLAEVRPSLLLEIGEPETIREAIWQLAAKLDPSAVRLLSLEPGGPRSLPPVPRREGQLGDRSGRSTVPDQVDPYGLVKALPALRGQKVLIVGRLDKELLWYQPRSGPEQSVLAKDVREAAAASDIALVLLDTRAARQPGERTWALLKVGVPGLADAMKGPTIADFYNALGSAQGRLVMRVLEVTADRTRLEAVPFKSAWGRALDERGLGGTLKEIVTGLTGNVVPTTVHMELRSRARQTELDRRWLPGIPSVVQIGYALLMALGLAGWPMARRWWGRIWPAESRTEYDGGFGYWAAQIVRGLVFVVIFVPLVAVAAFPAQVIAGLGETLLLALRAMRRRRTLPAGSGIGPQTTTTTGQATTPGQP